MKRENLYLCMKYGPFRFAKNISCRRNFRGFLEGIFKHNRNSTCKIENCDLPKRKFKYLNENVPKEVIDK